MLGHVRTTESQTGRSLGGERESLGEGLGSPHAGWNKLESMVAQHVGLIVGQDREGIGFVGFERPLATPLALFVSGH